VFDPRRVGQKRKNGSRRQPREKDKWVPRRQVIPEHKRYSPNNQEAEVRLSGGKGAGAKLSSRKMDKVHHFYIEVKNGGAGDGRGGS